MVGLLTGRWAVTDRVVDGTTVHVGGHGPIGGAERFSGKVGSDLTLEDGYRAARATALSSLATLADELGDLDRIGRFVKAFGMVNVAPGFTRTDMTQGNRSAAEWKEIEASFAVRAITGRVGEPEDIANAVAFFAAPEASWITAQVLAVDGGRMDFIGHG